MARTKKALITAAVTLRSRALSRITFFLLVCSPGFSHKKGKSKPERPTDGWTQNETANRAKARGEFGRAHTCTVRARVAIAPVSTARHSSRYHNEPRRAGGLEQLRLKSAQVAARRKKEPAHGKWEQSYTEQQRDDEGRESGSAWAKATASERAQRASEVHKKFQDENRTGEEFCRGNSVAEPVATASLTLAGPARPGQKRLRGEPAA